MGNPRWHLEKRADSNMHMIKKTAIPKSQTIQYQILKSFAHTYEKKDSGADPANQHDHTNTGQDEELLRRPGEHEQRQRDAEPLANRQTETIEVMRKFNDQLMDYATSRQYESSTLPGRQLGLALPPSPFSELQQRQSKYDGQFEADEKTRRDLVEVVAKEPPAHILREARTAATEGRPQMTAYTQVPLTGCSLTLLPGYQLLQNFGREHRIIEQGEMMPSVNAIHEHSEATLDDVCVFAADAVFESFRKPSGTPGQEVDAQDMINDATNWEAAYAHDYRWLSGHNHDHVCATTCVKKMKKATMEDKKKRLKEIKRRHAISGFFMSLFS